MINRNENDKIVMKSSVKSMTHIHIYGQFSAGLSQVR